MTADGKREEAESARNPTNLRSGSGHLAPSESVLGSVYYRFYLKKKEFDQACTPKEGHSGSTNKGWKGCEDEKKRKSDEYGGLGCRKDKNIGESQPIKTVWQRRPKEVWLSKKTGETGNKSKLELQPGQMDINGWGRGLFLNKPRGIYRSWQSYGCCCANCNPACQPQHQYSLSLFLLYLSTTRPLKTACCSSQCGNVGANPPALVAEKERDETAPLLL